MKKTLLILFFIFSAIQIQAQSTVPFVVEIQEYQRQNAPGLQSYTIGESGNYWLLIGGRTNGMHSFPVPPLGGFAVTEANSRFYVYDPTTDSVWSRSIFADLPLAMSGQFRSTNMEFFQNVNTLYIAGGYGKDSVGSLDTFVTFSKFSAINVSGMINAIKTNSSVAPYVRQITDTTFAVTGGELKKINSSYYIVTGQMFTGKYGFPNSGPPLFFQKYTDCVKKFDIVDDGTNLSITNKSYIVDTTNLHRRDLNVVQQITSSSGTQGVTIYGGVFHKDEDVPFIEPVYIASSSISIEPTFKQRFSHYHCPVLPAYDSARNNMTTLFFGGISLYSYDTVQHKAVIDSCDFGGLRPCVPFITDITGITKFSNGTSKDSILPIRYPQNRKLGADGDLILESSLPKYPNGVIRLNSITSRTFVGYIYGGIEAFEANPFVTMINSRGRNAGTGSNASKSIFKIYITPNTIGINPLGTYLPSDFKLFQNYPNPFNPTTKIKFDIPLGGFTSVKIYDIMGREVDNLVNENLKAGSYEIEFNGVNKASGIYYYKIYTDKFQETKKMILVK